MLTLSPLLLRIICRKFSDELALELVIFPSASGISELPDTAGLCRIITTILPAVLITPKPITDQ